MLFASRIACRKEPVPLSLVFVTVKTNGAIGLRALAGSRVTVASGSLMFPMPPMLVNRVDLGEVAKIDARKTELINIKATVNAMRSAKACGGVFFFIVFFGVKCGEGRGPRSYSILFYGKTKQKFQEKHAALR